MGNKPIKRFSDGLLSVCIWKNKGTSADAYDNMPIYHAPNGRAGLVPLLYHGIYAIVIKPYRRKSRARW